MVSPGSLLGIAFIVVLHTAIAAVGTRYFRVRLATQWGAVVYTLFLVPIVLTVTLLILAGGLGIGGPIGDRTTALLLAYVFPMTLGYTIDVFWMPAPEDVELPDRRRDHG